jgi:hypothetical protein
MGAEKLSDVVPIVLWVQETSYKRRMSFLCVPPRISSGWQFVCLPHPNMLSCHPDDRTLKKFRRTRDT